MAEANRLTEEPRDTLFSQWKTFGKVLLNPLVLLFVLLAITLVWYQWHIQSRPDADAGILAVLTLLTSILAGIAATLVTRRWSAITEEGVAVVRGRSAIRNLTFQISNLGLLKNRVRLYISRLGENPERGLVAGCFEEILDKCRSLELNAVNSIEDWSDIIPAAQVRTKIALIEELEAELDAKDAHMEWLKDEFEEAQAASGEETERLRQDLQKARSERDQVKKELAETKASIDRSVLSGIGDVPSTYPGTIRLTPPMARTQYCSRCGKSFSTYLPSPDGLCYDCRDKGLSPPMTT